jgi:hypothetical protein
MLKHPVVLATLLLISSTSGLLSSAPTLSEPHSPSVHQLRIYEIFDHNKQAFHDRFRDHAMRIMARYDFSIVAMWESKNAEGVEFVYVLEWPDENTMQDRWKRFLADKEWSRIKKETAASHGQLVGDIEDRTMRLTDYSPRLD